ncbi:MAG: hypothetical protein HKL99_13135 [Burkholderiales bacterium]|jgi:hypothetical protein|nr:hypothetical protein [Burkholderiales bacterium]
MPENGDAQTPDDLIDTLAKALVVVLREAFSRHRAAADGTVHQRIAPGERTN